MGPLQTVYKEISTKLRARYSQKCLIDIVSEDEQRKIIFDEHKKAHRNYDENKLQISRTYYWPKMGAIIKQQVQKCHTGQVSKYTRHPDKSEFQEVPIPKHSAQIFEIDLFTIEREWFITSIDSFTKPTLNVHSLKY